MRARVVRGVWGARIFRLRRAQGWSRATAARHLGVSCRTVAHYELGEIVPGERVQELVVLLERVESRVEPLPASAARPSRTRKAWRRRKRRP